MGTPRARRPALRSDQAAVGAYQRPDRIVAADDIDDMRDRVVADWYQSAPRGAGVDDRRPPRAKSPTSTTAPGSCSTTPDVRARPGCGSGAGSSPKATGSWPPAATTTTSTSSTATSAPSPTSTTTATSPSAATAPGRPRTMPAELVGDGLLDHGYARTNHKAQGATVDRCFVLGDDGDLDHQAGYAALSRGRTREPPLRPTTRHRNRRVRSRAGDRRSRHQRTVPRPLPHPRHRTPGAD